MFRRLLSLTLCAGVLLLPLRLHAAPARGCHAEAMDAPHSELDPHAGHASAAAAADDAAAPADAAPPSDAGAHPRAAAHSQMVSHPHATSYPHAHAAQAGAAQAGRWEVQGRYLDACRCNAPCPCHFGIRPDYASCDPTLVFHITDGRFEGVELDGLTAVVVTTGGKARLYLDERGDAEQRRGLEEVARALAGTLLRDGFRLPADQVVSARAISTQMADDRAVVTMAGVLELDAEWLVGGDGSGRITIQNLNLGPAWMTEAWAGRSATYRYSDSATWDYSGRNAYFGLFEAASRLHSPGGLD